MSSIKATTLDYTIDGTEEVFSATVYLSDEFSADRVAVELAAAHYEIEQEIEWPMVFRFVWKGEQAILVEQTTQVIFHAGGESK